MCYMYIRLFLRMGICVSVYVLFHSSTFLYRKISLDGSACKMKDNRCFMWHEERQELSVSEIWTDSIDLFVTWKMTEIISLWHEDRKASAFCCMQNRSLWRKSAITCLTWRRDKSFLKTNWVILFLYEWDSIMSTACDNMIINKNVMTEYISMCIHTEL